jgi:CRISPR-associated protein Cas2
MEDHLYIVTYDISDPRRWRAVYDIMNGYGEWLQLSVFQCRLTRRRHSELIALLDQLIHHGEDHVLIVDIGIADKVTPRIISLGKTSFESVKREPVIV